MLPYIENNSLAEKLSGDKAFLDRNEKSKIVLKKGTRLKILYQVACAMAFLHRKIPKFRYVGQNNKHLASVTRIGTFGHYT